MTLDLPRPIEAVTAPQFFSPSKLFQAEACGMSAWCGDVVLPEPIRSIVGRVLHTAREIVVSEGLTGEHNTARVRELIARVREEEEARLASTPDRIGMGLDVAFGKRRWLQRVAALELWARELPRGSPIAATSRASSVEIFDASADTFDIGAERTWVSTKLRLRGRPDCC